VIWRCNGKYGSGVHAKTPHLTDGQIQAAFLAAFNQRLENRAEIFAACNEVLRALTDTTALDAEAGELNNERDIVAELTRKCVRENASAALDQEEYTRRYDALKQRYDTAISRLNEVEAQRLERTAKHAEITRFLKTLVKGGDIVTEFDEELWYITVESVVVHVDGKITVNFRDGVSL
jgi:exonuclease VII large subunit